MSQPLLRGLRTVQGVIDPETVMQANVEAINDTINYLIPDSDQPGAPTSGDHALYERWIDGDYVTWV